MSALIRLLLSAESVQLQPGQEAEVTITVQNLSEIVDRYTIAVEGVEPSWLTLSRSEVSLFPKDQDQVRLSLRLPAGSTARAGLLPLQVVATSRDNPAERTAVPLQLDVLAVPSFEVALRPQRQAGMLQADYRLFLNNAGNADLNVQLSASDPEEACLYTFEPPAVVLSPGQERIVTLRVRPKLPPREQPVVYPFTVAARPLEAPKAVRQAMGEFVQTPPEFAVVLQPPRARGSREGLFVVQVTNQGSLPVKAKLQAADAEQRCLFLLDPAEVEVPAAGQATSRLRVRFKAPPADGAPRTAEFTVTVQAADAPSVSSQAQGAWEQTPPALELAIQPGQQGPASALFVLLLKNGSDVDLALSLSASDPQQAGLYALNPALASVPAGQTRTVGLTVQPNPAVRRQAVAFTVTAQSAEFPGLARQVQGTWQPANAPAPAAAHAPRPRLWGALAVLLIGGLIAIALALGAVFVTQSVVAFFVVWAAVMLGAVFLARAVWNGPRFWPFLAILVVVWILASGIGYLIADAVDRAPMDQGILPLIIFGLFWLGGFVGGLLLARRVAMPK